MSCCCNRQNCCDPASSVRDAGRGFTTGRLIGGAIRLVLLYLAIAFVGGTLMQTGNPTLANIGEFAHLVLFVEPLQYWLMSHGVAPLGEALHIVANGVDPMPILGSVRAIL